MSNSSSCCCAAAGAAAAAAAAAARQSTTWSQPAAAAAAPAAAATTAVAHPTLCCCCCCFRLRPSSPVFCLIKHCTRSARMESVATCDVVDDALEPLVKPTGSTSSLAVAKPRVTLVGHHGIGTAISAPFTFWCLPTALVTVTFLGTNFPAL